MTTAAVIAKPDAVVDAIADAAAGAGDAAAYADASNAVVNGDAVADAGEFLLRHPVSVNIRPILESVGGRLTEDEVDQWFAGLAAANEGRGFYLELTGKGELVINPMVNMDSNFAEVELVGRMFVWNEGAGGRVSGPRGIVRLPDGSRVEPDAAWLSPAQVAELGPVRSDRAITVCPVFVAEIMSASDRLGPLQRKMERYVANGALLGWLIDPYRRRVYIYRPGVEVEILDDPETISGEPVLPGFVFAVRERIFALQG